MAKKKIDIPPCPEIKDPFGEKKRNRYFYQKFWNMVHLLPERNREFVHTLIDQPEEKLDTMIQLMKLWKSADQFDRDDYHQASGRG